MTFYSQYVLLTPGYTYGKFNKSIVCNSEPHKLNASNLKFCLRVQQDWMNFDVTLVDTWDTDEEECCNEYCSI